MDSNDKKKLGFYVPHKIKVEEVAPSVTPSEKKKRKPKQKTFNNEWERYEAWNFKKENIIPNIKFPNSSKSYSLNPQKFTLKVVLFFALMNNKTHKNIKTINWDKPNNANNKSKALWVAEKRWKENQHPTKIVGNINYSQLKKAQGENFQVKLPSNQLATLINQPIFYSARVDVLAGTATVTVKEKDKQFLSKLLGLSETSQLEKQNEALTNRDIYTKIKQEAQANNEKLEYLVVTPEQLKELQTNFVEFASFNKDGKFNIAFLPKTKARISKLLFPQKEKNVETEFQKNSRINTELKTLSAVNNDKLRYKLITQIQYEKLKTTDIKFAAFSQKETGKVNIVYLESSSEKVKQTTNEEQKKEQNMGR